MATYCPDRWLHLTELGLQACSFIMLLRNENIKMTDINVSAKKAEEKVKPYFERIDEIAFALAERSFYKLTFKAVDLSIPEPTKIHETVHVSFDIDSGIWDMNNVEIADLAKHIMHGSDVIVKESNYFASFLLSREHKMQEIKKQRALAKLTPEERELLGLN